MTLGDAALLGHGRTRIKARYSHEEFILFHRSALCGVSPVQAHIATSNNRIKRQHNLIAIPPRTETPSALRADACRADPEALPWTTPK